MKQYKIKNSVGLYEYKYKDTIFTHEWSKPLADDFVTEPHDILVSIVVPSPIRKIFVTENIVPVYEAKKVEVKSSNESIIYPKKKKKGR